MRYAFTELDMAAPCRKNEPSIFVDVTGVTSSVLELISRDLHSRDGKHVAAGAGETVAKIAAHIELRRQAQRDWERGAHAREQGRKQAEQTAQIAARGPDKRLLVVERRLPPGTRLG